MRLLLFIVSILLFASASCLAANDLCFKAIQGGKEVKAICAGQPVSFQDCNNEVPDDREYYIFDYKNGTELPLLTDPVKEHTYTTPGKYRVLQIANYGGTIGTDTLSQVFEVRGSPSPDFDVKFCSGRKVIVNITDQQYDYYLLNFNDGTPVERAVKGQIITHTQAGTGDLEVIISSHYDDVDCSRTEVSFKTKALPAYSPPTINSLQVISQHNTTGSLNFTIGNLIEGYIYTLTRKLETEPGFTKVATLPANQATYSLNNTNTAVKATYKLDITDACGNTLGSSNTINSIILQAAAANGFNSITWQHTGTFERTSIYRDGTALPVNNPGSPYEDKVVKCGTVYTYQVWGESGNGTFVSKSVEQSVTTSSTIKPPVGKLWASYNLNNQVELRFTPPDGEQVQEVTFYRGSGNAVADRLTTIYNALVYTDELEKPLPYCYNATYKNECVVSDPSPSVCPMLLTGQQASDGSYQLSWTAYVGFSEGISGYVVELLDENNQVITEYPVNSNSYTDKNTNNEQVSRYRIRVVSNTNEISYSNFIEVEKVVQLHVPSGFTPNNDGLNDVFEVKGKFIKTYSIRIFNGMGQVVYTSQNREESWDGTYKGTPLPVGAYAYEIIATSESNKSRRRTGTITLLR